FSSRRRHTISTRDWSSDVCSSDLMAVLRAEGVSTPGPFHLNNTAAFIHRMDPHAVHTAATDSARTVRIQVITPPAALTRDGQKQLVKKITEIVTRISGDPNQASRTWVLLTDAAARGWGLAGKLPVGVELFDAVVGCSVDDGVVSV